MRIEGNPPSNARQASVYLPKRFVNNAGAVPDRIGRQIRRARLCTT